MKVVFLNVWNGKLAEEVAGFVEQYVHDVDVFCFQEAGESFIELISKSMKGYQLLQAHKDLAGDELDQATYVRNDWEVIKHQVLLQSEDEGGLALYTELRNMEEVWHLVNVHGASRPGDKLDTPVRLRQTEALVDFFDGLSGKKVIGGDFNLDYNSNSIGRFEQEGYRNLVKEYEIETTRNWYVWKDYPDDKQFYADYVLVRDGVEVDSFQVPLVEVSDHEPMVLEVV